MQANAYLRNPTSGARGRRFQVIVDLLAPPNQIQVRSFRDDYFVLVTPSAEPQADEVRHSYLHYLLDQMIFRNAEELNKRRALMDFAEGAPALDDVYKEDFFLLACESLVKAVEARISPSGKKQAKVNQALSEGFILTGAFYDALTAYEKQELAFRLYFKDMVTGIDLRAEVDRLDKVHFVYQRATKTMKAAPPPEAGAADRHFQDPGPGRRTVQRPQAGRRPGQVSGSAEGAGSAVGTCKGVLWSRPHSRPPARRRPG